MKNPLHTCALLSLATAVIYLPSCAVTQQTIDFSVFSDAVAPAQNDDVQVEVGSGLSASDSYTAPATPVAATPASPARTGGSAGSYTVLKGDTLSAIARKHQIPLAALYAANGLSEENSGIRDGQKLIIPAAGKSSPAPVVQVSTPAPLRSKSSKAGSYTIVKGDSISSIARRHGISRAALMQANGLTPETADKINAGQTLNIPTNNQ
ncbi:MAG: LysM peptidoglycan-binding domain-containing protein [Akkermansia sp.]|nr:LysM peptidoglycan-binding domain-containing protein [Akkermansia sp.]